MNVNNSGKQLPEAKSLNVGKHVEIMKSLNVFAKFISKNEKEDLDASQILSKDCFAFWLESRKKVPKCPDEAFRRALTAHVRGTDGRRPFSPEVERSLLKTLRKKERWTCFDEFYDKAYSNDPLRDKTLGSIGVQGFPSLGFHEHKNLHKEKDSAKASKTSLTHKEQQNERQVLNESECSNTATLYKHSEVVEKSLNNVENSSERISTAENHCNTRCENETNHYHQNSQVGQFSDQNFCVSDRQAFLGNSNFTQPNYLYQPLGNYAPVFVNYSNIYPQYPSPGFGYPSNVLVYQNDFYRNQYQHMQTQQQQQQPVFENRNTRDIGLQNTSNQEPLRPRNSTVRKLPRSFSDSSIEPKARKDRKRN